MDPRTRSMIKDYFKFHIPFVATSVTLFMLAFAVGPRTPLGLILVTVASFTLLMAPPVSLMLVKRKYVDRARGEQGGGDV